QPIEQVGSLRLIPYLSVWRPADAVETAVAWRSALTHKGPSVLALSRQKLPLLARNDAQIKAIEKGGYILWEPQQPILAIIIATGSEVTLALSAAQQLQEENYAVRVVSMPCTDVFDAQSAEYREQVLPRAITHRVAVEAGSTRTWAYYVGAQGKVIGLDRFGESAPYEKVYQALQITVENIINSIRSGNAN
ncbi:MAG TPA: transketolase C-terminal domain-containing protein, partial [Gammaproteobacteria bacterium]|nr:transketolase C-terminal domain-containing protein [Gammaproteobacteria bacterium]